MKSTLLCLLLMMAPGTYAQSNLWENPSVVDEGKSLPGLTLFLMKRKNKW